MQLRKCPRNRLNAALSGFSLLETIGILAVLSILAASIAPSFVARIDRLASDDEEEILSDCAAALVDFVNAERRLPGDDLAVLGDEAPESGALSNAIAERLGMRLESVRFNGRGNGRKFLCDPGFWDGVDTVFPVAQTVAGWAKPDKPRVIILSSVGAPLPEGGFDFETLWMAEEGAEISSGEPWSAWSGKWEDLRIQRIHLGRMFHHVVLNNIGASAGAGYKIDGAGDVSGNPAVLADAVLDSYYIEGSKLQLYSGGSLVATELVTSDRAYYYEDGVWRSSRLESGSDSSWVEDICDDIRNWVHEYGYSVDVVDVITSPEIFDIGADYCVTLE